MLHDLITLLMIHAAVYSSRLDPPGPDGIQDDRCDHKVQCTPDNVILSQWTV